MGDVTSNLPRAAEVFHHCSWPQEKKKGEQKRAMSEMALGKCYWLPGGWWVLGRVVVHVESVTLPSLT